jgi:hypothetical protein
VLAGTANHDFVVLAQIYFPTKTAFDYTPVSRFGQALQPLKKLQPQSSEPDRGQNASLQAKYAVMMKKSISSARKASRTAAGHISLSSLRFTTRRNWRRKRKPHAAVMRVQITPTMMRVYTSSSLSESCSCTPKVELPPALGFLGCNPSVGGWNPE